jgi:hypothetical protein
MTGDDTLTTRRPDLQAGIPATSLAERIPFLGRVEAEAVVLVRRGAEVAAIGATCTHWGGPLAEGLVVGDTIRRPWPHGAGSAFTLPVWREDRTRSDRILVDGGPSGSIPAASRACSLRSSPPGDP